jgi:hypothetical protein
MGFMEGLMGKQKGIDTLDSSPTLRNSPKGIQLQSRSLFPGNEIDGKLWMYLI